MHFKDAGIDKGQMFQDAQGLTVEVDTVDDLRRVHWTTVGAPGEKTTALRGVMSEISFQQRFSTRVAPKRVTYQRAA